MITKLFCRSHNFDQETRKKEKPKRKYGTISRTQLSARGSSGVREHHRIKEEKILAHRRSGYNDDELDLLLTLS